MGRKRAGIGLRGTGMKRRVKSHGRGRKGARKRTGKEQEKGKKEARKGRNGHERGSEGEGMGRKEVEMRQETVRNEAGEQQRRGTKE
jgi:hypothetical protein